MAYKEFDPISTEILIFIDRKKVPISKIQYSGIAAGQTIYNHIKKLIEDGYIAEEKSPGFPRSRVLYLTEKGLQALSIIKAESEAAFFEQARQSASPVIKITPAHEGILKSLISTVSAVNFFASSLLNYVRDYPKLFADLLSLHKAAKDLLDYLKLEYSLAAGKNAEQLEELDRDLKIKQQYFLMNSPAWAREMVTIQSGLDGLKNAVSQFELQLKTFEDIWKDHAEAVAAVRSYASVLSLFYNKVLQDIQNMSKDQTTSQ